MIFINTEKTFYDRRRAKKDQISTNVTSHDPDSDFPDLPFLSHSKLKHPSISLFGQGTPEMLLTLLKGLKDFIKCSKRQLIIIAAIRSKIYIIDTDNKIYIAGCIL